MALLDLESPQVCLTVVFCSSHSNIRGFMVQGGDPTGTGKGGESIWGGKMDDEFHPQNRHNCRGIVSMANNGPNTNRQQFFITYAKQPHLNNVYTVFAKCVFL
jgi:peptidyl-prolyl cis-trans isomerase-like 3